MEFGNKYKIKEGAGDIETHHVFLDTLAHSKEAELGISEKKFEVPLSKNLIYFLFAFFFLAAAGLFSKTFYLQIIEGKDLHAASESNKGRISIINPERGIIYDINGKKLVTNAPDFDLICDKKNLGQPGEAASKQVSQIANILGQDVAIVNEIISGSEESKVLISQNLPQEKLLVLEAKLSDLPDCAIEKNTLRNYVMGPIFSHVLGYTGKPTKEDLAKTSSYGGMGNVGKTGLEKYYQDVLRGTPGKIIRNLSNSDTPDENSDHILAAEKSGYNLVLNIDADLQKKTYDSLAASIKNIGAKRGAAIALNPQTGAVLAIVSYPAYDNNIFSQGISQKDYQALLDNQNQPFFNRAIAAQYPTGSTIKPFLASGALQENLISPTKIINDPGYILVKNQYNPEVTYKFAGVIPHGPVDMREAIAVSSNIYFYTIGGGFEGQQGLGPTRIKKYLDMYGWEQKTGIDLPGEFGGFVPSPEWKKEKKNESWWDGDTYNLSIGQSDLQVTPLQVAVAYAAIANGGTLYKPQMVQKITSGSGDGTSVIQEFRPEIASQLSIDQKNLQIVREGMLDGVQKDYGSSVMLRDLPVKVAGKTGTVETNKDGVFNTWSSNFAPYENPEIVFVATIEGVAGLRSATLPVAHEVLGYYFSKK